ncbi:hypothetical protein HDU96_000648 [Phlyctochytrium bullatum]|nr:hypothetical protein HDU96_000648 [Phlyctochytrium bullatum]
MADVPAATSVTADALLASSPLIAALWVGAILMVLLLIVKTREDSLPKYPRDVVVLHAFERPVLNPGIPSYLETYLRVARIPYVHVTNTGYSKKGKKPYISYNGEVIEDSRFCIEWLEEKFKPGVERQIMPAARTAMEAYKSMVEDGLSKQFVYWRWSKQNLPWIKANLLSTMPSLLRAFLAPLILESSLSYLKLDISRDETDHAEIADDRLRALSNLLGDEAWFMSTERPTSLDCSVFGFLCNLLLQNIPSCEWPGVLVKKFPNLVLFVRRMLEEYYPEHAVNVDWDEIDDEVMKMAEDLEEERLLHEGLDLVNDGEGWEDETGDAEEDDGTGFVLELDDEEEMEEPAPPSRATRRSGRRR